MVLKRGGVSHRFSVSDFRGMGGVVKNWAYFKFMNSPQSGLCAMPFTLGIRIGELGKRS